MADADTDHSVNYYINTVKIPYIGLDVNIDDLVYLSCMVLAIPIGILFKKISFNPSMKAFVSSGIGLCMGYLVCSKDIYHSLIVTFINSLFITVLSPKYVQYFSFIWCFGYLVFFRTTTYFGFSYPVQFANAVQLLLTLKSIGLAFEVHDTWLRKKTVEKLAAEETLTEEETTKMDKLKLEMEFSSLNPKPSFLSMFLYSYCYIGFLTGPYYKYRTYHDWLNTKYNKNVKTLSFMISRGKTLPIIVITYLIVSRIASFKDARTDEFYENPFWYRFVYMTLMFTLFKLRFYFAWILAEYSCMTAGFGAYPNVCKPRPGGGPTNLAALKEFDINESKDKTFNFNAIHNIDEYGVEMAPTVKSVLHTWNETVQFWMANFVYKRVFFRPIGQGWTMFVSAYWHGLHPGYYMSMLTCTPGIWAEEMMDKGFKQRFLSPKNYYLFTFFIWFCRTRLFDYMSMGFILLDYESTIRFWKSVYFIGHVYCVVFIVLGYVLCKLFPKPKSKKEE